MKICIIDTETTRDQTVADFGAVIADLSTGEKLDEIGCLIYGQFDEVELWSDPRAKAGDFWSLQNNRARRKKYIQRIQNGQRSIASENLINVWLAKNCGRYPDLIVTAYNLAFDKPKCDNTGINLGLFSREFCLLKATRQMLKDDLKFYEFCARQGALSEKTGKPSFTADNVARYFLGDALDPEPHTALEDARDYELPIAKALYSTNPNFWEV
jgi:hypothetical protein